MNSKTRSVDRGMIGFVITTLLSAALFAEQPRQSSGANKAEQTSGAANATGFPTDPTANNVRPKANNLTPIGPLGMLLVGQATVQIMSPCAAGYSIVKPNDNSSFPLSANNITASDSISFQSNGGANSNTLWNVQVSYATSGGKGSSRATKNFSSNSNSPVSEQFQSMGGQGNVRAICQTASGSNQTDNVTITITGAPISRSGVVNRLVSLYGAAQPTPRLMTGFAMKESTCQQFKSKTLFGVSALWPYESYDGGSHIGLMMVGTTMQDAFDWTINTQDGVNLFFEKLGIAKANVRKIQATHTGLQNLTPFEMENMAILLYGPYAPRLDPLDRQYYAPSCAGGTESGTACNGGSWQWILNQDGVLGDAHGDGISYVADVRNEIQ